MVSAVTSVDAQMVSDIRRAIKESSERGLAVASKWCAIQWYFGSWTLMFSQGIRAPAFNTVEQENGLLGDEHVPNLDSSSDSVASWRLASSVACLGAIVRDAGCFIVRRCRARFGEPRGGRSSCCTRLHGCKRIFTRNPFAKRVQKHKIPLPEYILSIYCESSPGSYTRDWVNRMKKGKRKGSSKRLA